jgi:catechol 2,3-dioxygenase-like lactoylglutathione lyase family enzyme
VPAPQASLTAVTLGVSDLPRSVRFYAALGFVRRMPSTGDEVAFFAAGGVVLALYPWDLLGDDAALRTDPRPLTFRGVTLAWNCASSEDVEAALARATNAGGRVLKTARDTPWGGYAGYFADPDGHPWEVVHAPMFSLTEDGRLLVPAE